jgi:hypothetical protein
MSTKKVKIMNIVIDPDLQVREIDIFTVSNYSESVKAGNIFPPIIIDSKNRLICGHHRYSAYKRNFDPDYFIDCEVTPLKNNADLIMLAAGDNSKNGRPLTTYEKKCISLRLIKDHGISVEKVSNILGVRVDRIDEWAGITVLVKTYGKKSVLMPVKRGFEYMAGAHVTSSDYNEHRKKDYGVPLRTHVNQILSIIRREKIWIRDEAALLELYKELKNYFKTQKGE